MCEKDSIGLFLMEVPCWVDGESYSSNRYSVLVGSAHMNHDAVISETYRLSARFVASFNRGAPIPALIARLLRHPRTPGLYSKCTSM